MSYVSLKESIERLVMNYNLGETFTTHDIYDVCRHREATLMGIAHYLQRSNLVERTTNIRGKPQTWRRVA